MISMLPLGGAVTTLIWAGFARSVTIRWNDWAVVACCSKSGRVLK